MKTTEKYYETQLRNRSPSPYSTFTPTKEVSAYDIGMGVLGQADTYTREIKILKTLSREEKIAVTKHEQQHIDDPSLPEWFVRDVTGTHLN